MSHCSFCYTRTEGVGGVSGSVDSLWHARPIMRVVVFTLQNRRGGRASHTNLIFMKTLLRLWPAILFVGGLLALSPAHAEPFRIGMVNPDRIFKEANSVKAMQARLQQEFAAREKALVAQGTALQNLAAAFDRDAPTLSAVERIARQRQLADRDLEFQRARRTMQEDVDTRTNEERQRLMELSNLVVKQIAEAEKYDLVLQQAVYFNPKNDLTSKVIERLNSQSAK